MATELSPEIQRAILAEGIPVSLVDPATNKRYRLIEEEQFQRLTAILDAPWSREEQSQMLRNAGKRAGWDDPEMDAYDRLDDSAKQP